VKKPGESCCSKAEVLLVDDVIFNLLPLKAIVCKKFNLKCDEAENGLIAVDKYYRSMTKTCCEVRYKAIFTDIQMPEMDGITEVQTILSHQKILLKKNPNLPKVHFVMVTAYDDEEIVKKCNSMGIYDYLLKPVSFQKLLPIC